MTLTDALTAFLDRAAVALGPSLERAVKDRARVADRVVFDQVAEAAQPFVAALVARRCAGASRRLWIVCPTPRAQERLHAEITNWFPGALLLPDIEVAAVEGAIADPEVTAERLAVLERLREGETGGGVVVVVHEGSFGEPVPARGLLRDLTRVVRVGDPLDQERFVQDLLGCGYEVISQVAERGQVAIRGGIVDFFSWQHPLPLRLEFFDDQIESIREFDPHQQTSVRTRADCRVLLGEPAAQEGTVEDYAQSGDVFMGVESDYSKTRVNILAEGSTAGGMKGERLAFHDLDLDALKPRHASSAPLHELRRLKVGEQLAAWDRERTAVAVFCRHERERPALEALVEAFPTLRKNLSVFLGELTSGFTFPAAGMAVATGFELLGYSVQPGALSSRAGGGPGGRRDVLASSRVHLNLDELREGDLMVHLEHGVCRFAGLQASSPAAEETAGSGEQIEDMLVLEFADHAKLYVPLEQSYLVSRYVGLGKRHVALNRLGDGKWVTAKRAAEKAVFDYAAKMIKLQAIRESRHGFAFAPDAPWQQEFENTFPYKETADQLKAIAAVKEDMESTRPMDRLICGDVGFGKTEIAIRAAFKAVMGGKQVVMLVPTTVLAQQHYDNFCARMETFPVRVELLSRFCSAAEQRRAVEGLRDGSVDLVIGTHRLISKGVEFKDLGLLIVDEEQRFGVRHKEQIKERFPTVDVITLSATPIPRTLYLALTGARDLSTLETPPPNRHPIETVICPYDERVIREALKRELGRQGQVFFLHNRIESIERVRRRLLELCPQARVELGHGQMDEEQLEEVMHRFVRGETDVLVATTIIESGLDIPNANTIIIDRADRFGLADLYQLRGRVGRGQHKAYAYLMLPRDWISAGEARKRINAIRQYSSLGAGFRIALRDLEIRGAGNILGLAQSGHITAVGFDLYCQLLRQAVAQLKGETVRARVEVVLRLDFVATGETEFLQRQHAAPAPDPDGGNAAPDGAFSAHGVLPAFLPADFIQEPRLRIQAYRQLAEISEVVEVRSLRAAWRDRFGALPPPVDHLLSLSELRLAAAARGVQQVETKGDKLMLRRRGDYLQPGGKFPRLTSPDPVNRLREIFSLLNRFAV